MIKIKPLLFLLTLVVVLTSCGKPLPPVEYVRMPKAPPPEIVAEEGTAKKVKASVIKWRLQKQIPDIEKLVIGDRYYLFITDKWFRAVIDWTEKFIKKQVPGKDFVENFPLGYEETFAVLASSVANLSVARRYNIKASVLIGLITAENKKPWGKIPADGQKRVYVIGLTQDGGIIYDLKTKQTTRFEDFANFDYIKSILI